MLQYDTTTIVIAAAVIVLAVVASLVNPFFRGITLPDDDDDDYAPSDDGETGPADDEATVPAASDGESHDSGNSKYPPVSVIITTYDSKPELTRNLPAVLKQDYPDFQVIVVYGEHETDTEDWLKKMHEQYSNLYFTFAPETNRYLSHKKLAITLGVKAARNEWIVLTESTCCPDTEDWLKSLSRNFTRGNDIVAGYAHYADDCPDIYRFIRLQQAHYLLRRAQRKNAILTNMPVVCFRKSKFMSENGYQGYLQHVNGEYSFLINKYSDDDNTAVELSRRSWLTEDAPSRHAWHTQRIFYYAIRHSLNGCGSTSLLYAVDRIVPHLSLIVSIAAVIFGVLSMNLTVALAGMTAILILFFTRMGIAWHACNKFDEPISAIKLPFYEWATIFRNAACRIKYLTANKKDFTTHKV